ncbi:hypothetical protein NEOLEDRAFT_1129617 [Neolentinus lepideus HHB14362 ss-1]|uniref:Uncharacterized protein n=1 Tax=Neolentinus lepideus HHB14362 ss-1 TaxID=1314782 RepID=A0A165UJI0_9AGAM|nr:hypothetical protein NEOLEDRAFT_1129617 [Neolentinus lepideus HHB14362 ss-1]
MDLHTLPACSSGLTLAFLRCNQPNICCVRRRQNLSLFLVILFIQIRDKYVPSHVYSNRHILNLAQLYIARSSCLRHSDLSRSQWTSWLGSMPDSAMQQFRYSAEEQTLSRKTGPLGLGI